MFDVVDHDLADRHEAIMLGRESRHATHETFLTLHDNGDGTMSGRFTVPEARGRILRWFLDRLTAPRRLGRTAGGRPCVDESAPEGAGLSLSGWEKQGLAFCELLDHLPTDGWNGRNAATVLVRIDLDDLLAGVGVAGLDGGTRITAGEARRLACEATLVPTVFGGDSVPARPRSRPAAP